MPNNDSKRSLIFGCGDVGRRIGKELITLGAELTDLSGYVNSHSSRELTNIQCDIIDLDQADLELSACGGADVYYTVAPQKHGLADLRSRQVIAHFTSNDIRPNKVVLISTTGVYGDCGGEWVCEQSPARPQTERGKRRLDSEAQWLAWGRLQSIDVVVLRVPGIYAFSRLPRERIKRKTPVVRASECGFTNRIHADDLARICVAAMRRARTGEIYNATDGVPGKISEYLQEATRVLGFDPLPEISLVQAKSELSVGMLSYLSESRKISNQKMLDDLGLELRYPDFKFGLTK